MDPCEAFKLALDTLEAIAEQRVLVMDDEGETTADALANLARRTLLRIYSAPTLEGTPSS